MKFKNPIVTVDVVAYYRGGIVLIERGKDPFKGYWALPGGHLEYGKENLEQAALRELKEETGLTGKLKDLVLYKALSNPDRDPRGHVVTLVYLLHKAKGPLKANDDAAKVKVVKKKIPKKIAFDHEPVIKKCIDALNDDFSGYD